MEKLKRLLRSRKFWAALIGLGMVVVRAFAPDFPLTEEQVGNLVYVLMAYILGVALEDGLTAGRGQMVKTPDGEDPRLLRERFRTDGA